ncbi:hypothetical protein Y1Q_0018454 [Alligator mississippiensis]|uniref:Uncharacterized protein n=1 Tax=Alligator mississippiensis TaxID=8496 RepID=A0A151PCP3_ALLMI|nr:hypothetical protein Y1Q_0018454 [Alligator mississippiensis]
MPSVPCPTATSSAPSELGLPDGVIDLVRELYRGCTTTVCATDGATVEIPIQSGLQQMPDVTSEAARWMGLRFNVTKYTSLHINRRQKSRVLDSTLTIQGQQRNPWILQFCSKFSADWQRSSLQRAGREWDEGGQTGGSMCMYMHMAPGSLESSSPRENQDPWI